jgi:hypothetical protein
MRPRQSVRVVPSARTAWKDSFTEPNRMVSPSANVVTDSTRRLPINVPFLLPRSSSVARVPVIRMRACRRETRGESTNNSNSGSRPSTCSPSRNANRRPSHTSRKRSDLLVRPIAAPPDVKTIPKVTPQLCDLSAMLDRRRRSFIRRFPDGAQMLLHVTATVRREDATDRYVCSERQLCEAAG